MRAHERWFNNHNNIKFFITVIMIVKNIRTQVLVCVCVCGTRSAGRTTGAHASDAAMIYARYVCVCVYVLAFESSMRDWRARVQWRAHVPRAALATRASCRISTMWSLIFSFFPPLYIYIYLPLTCVCVSVSVYYLYIYDDDDDDVCTCSVAAAGQLASASILWTGTIWSELEGVKQKNA